MNKPAPKYQAVIRLETEGRLEITTQQQDAINWLTQHAPQFGVFSNPPFAGMGFHLSISSDYDSGEVVRYIASEIGAVIRDPHGFIGPRPEERIAELEAEIARLRALLDGGERG